MYFIKKNTYIKFLVICHYFKEIKAQNKKKILYEFVEVLFYIIRCFKNFLESSMIIFKNI